MGAGKGLKDEGGAELRVSLMTPACRGFVAQSDTKDEPKRCKTLQNPSLFS